MKSFTIAAFVALASVVTAQFEDIPSCAINCFLAPLTSDGCSSLTDFACHCKSADSLFAAVIPCVEKACTAAEQSTVISAVEGTCEAAGVPIQVPGVSSAAPSVAPSTSAVPSSTVASTSAVPSSTVASTVAPTATPTSTEVPVTSEAPVSSAVVSGTPSPSGNGTVPSSVSPTTSLFSGAAAQATHAAGIIGAAALAFLAL